MKAALLVLFAACLAESSVLPLQVIVELVGDLRARFSAGCVYVLHDSDADGKLSEEHVDLIEAWRTAAGSMSIGVMHVWRMLRRAPADCRTPLYVVLGSGHRVLRQVSDAGAFSGAKWLIFSQSDHQLAQLNVPFNCEVLVADWEGEKVKLREIYRVTPKLPLHIHHFGYWDLRTRSNWSRLGLYQRRSSLDGYTIKTTVLNDGIFVTLRQSEGKQTLEGYIGLIWSELEREMNFTSEFYEPEDGSTGSEINGSWGGMVGMLVRGDAQVGAASFLMTVKRLDVIDYTNSLAEAGTNVYIKRPEVYTLPWTNCLAPFSQRLWFCVLAVMGLLTIVLSAMCNLQHHYGNRKEMRFGFRDSWLCVLGIFCQQGHDVTPYSSACRIVYITSYACAIVLLAGYAGNYISVLSSGRPLVLPFTDLRGMLRHGSYRLGAMRGSAQLNFFDNTTDPQFKEVYRKLIAPDVSNLPASYHEAFQRVCESKYAFLSSALLMRRFTSNVTCSCIAVPQANMPGVIAMATAKRSPYRGLINHNLLKMQNAAMMKRFRDLTLARTEEPPHREWATISLDEVIPTISIFVLGVLTSLLILAVECWIERVLKRRRAAETGNKLNLDELVMTNGELKVKKRSLTF